MKLITKLTMICILISALEKLVTYVSMRMFPYETGECNLLALRIWSVLGLELGIVFVFVLSTVGMVGIRKTVDICPKDISPKIKKAATALLIILIIMHACILIYNLCVFMDLQKC